MIDLGNIVEEYKKLGWEVSFENDYMTIYLSKKPMEIQFRTINQSHITYLNNLLLIGHYINSDAFTIYYQLYKETQNYLCEIDIGAFLCCQQIKNKKQVIEILNKLDEWGYRTRLSLYYNQFPVLKTYLPDIVGWEFDIPFKNEVFDVDVFYKNENELKSKVFMNKLGVDDYE